MASPVCSLKLFGEPVSTPYQLSRLRYGTFLHRKTGIPILISGGSVSGNERRSLAETMAYELQENFGIRAEWIGYWYYAFVKFQM